MPYVETPPKEEWELLDQWHGKRSHLRVINVGAGVAGILVAYKMRKMMTDYELVCYDK
jgi:cation diffusion facilitator CzcD-associated flavoprotein CzcO